MIGPIRSHGDAGIVQKILKGSTILLAVTNFFLPPCGYDGVKSAGENFVSHPSGLGTAIIIPLNVLVFVGDTAVRKEVGGNAACRVLLVPRGSHIGCVRGEKIH